MVVTVARGHRALARLVRLLALVAVADLVTHDAIYRSIDAAGGRPQPLTEHGYWPLFLLVVVAVVTSGLVRSVRRVRYLKRVLRTGTPFGPVAATSFDRGALTGHARTPTYHRELLVLWPAVAAGTALAFLVQENIEHVVATGSWFGLAPLDGRLHPDAVLLLLAASLVVAAAGAHVRWRVRALEHCLEVAALVFPRPAADCADRSWRLVASACQHRRLLVRLDAGRAPPIRS